MFTGGQGVGPPDTAGLEAPGWGSRARWSTLPRLASVLFARYLLPGVTGPGISALLGHAGLDPPYGWPGGTPAPDRLMGGSPWLTHQAGSRVCLGRRALFGPVGILLRRPLNS